MLEGKPITHVYAFNLMFCEEDNQDIVDKINRSSHVQALAWSKSEHSTFSKYGLKDFELHSKVMNFSL